MDKKICRIHVLKRFSAFEWALLISVVNLLAINQEFLLKYSSLAIVIPALLMAIISSLFFNKEKYLDFENFCVNELKARRYFDLFFYIILIFLCGLYAFFWGLFPLIFTSVMFDYHWFAGSISFVICFIIPLFSFVERGVSENPSKFQSIIFKLIIPYELLQKKIDDLHCVKNIK